jgi:hypothetical protein
MVLKPELPALLASLHALLMVTNRLEENYIGVSLYWFLHYQLGAMSDVRMDLVS